MILKDVIYEDGHFWIYLKDGYYHVYEDVPFMGYAEHRMLTDDLDHAKRWIEVLKREKEA